ncbi:membrane protein [Armatimonadota bacterium]|nr:membrane protein [Armatimonadota bacterium]
MKYLTQLLDKKVYQQDGTLLGKTIDVIAQLNARFPSISAIHVQYKESLLYIPFDCVEFEDDPEGPSGAGNLQSDLRLTIPVESVPAYTLPPNTLHLRRDVLDKQIVDVHDFRVVRVNDVRLAECGTGYCVVGVDASLRAMLRRFGVVISKPIEATAHLFHTPLRANLIAWDDMQTLEPGTAEDPLRLKVSHDKIARLHPADIAEIVEQLTPQQRVEVLESLDDETIADAIAEVDPDMQVEIMQQLDLDKARDVITHMEPDDAADVLDDMPDSRSDDILDKMNPEDAEALNRLMEYHEDTAGGLMTTEYVAIPDHITCEETIQNLRALAPRAEMIYYVYIVDDDNRLVGVLSLRDLVVSPPETIINNIMVKNVIRVHVDDHANEVAQVIGRYNLLAAPVVDEEERLLGIITVDDTLERLLPQERRRRLPSTAWQDAQND